MFRWYRKSEVCFVYLEDIPKGPKRKVIAVEVDSERVTYSPFPLDARRFFSTNLSDSKEAGSFKNSELQRPCTSTTPCGTK